MNADPQDTQQISILVVEDEAIVAQDIQERVSSLGYRVAGWVTSGEEAVEQAHAQHPDLVLMDVRLQGDMDGIEAAGRIREELDIPVVFLTAFADDETLARAKLSEPFGYLLKPFELRELKTSVRLALYKHETDRALREREGFLQTLFEAMPSSLLVLDGEYHVRMLNRAAEQTFRLQGLPDGARRLGDLLRCENSVNGGCGLSTACGSCNLGRSIQQALAGESVHGRRCPFTFQANGVVHRLELMVSAVSLDYQGQRMAVLIMQDSTELVQLRRMLSGEQTFSGIVGTSPQMQQVFATIREIADVEVPVLIQGETGTGKELVARAIHDRGPRSDRAFVAVNCGAIPDGLLESELFGHVKGAFTGAVRDRKGRFSLADGGTIFLDEIGDLSLGVQVKLLRVLQEGSFEAVGSDRTITVDVRIISATNKDLLQEVNEGRFRMDLYYRLCVVPVEIPPLRRRQTDIPLIAEHLLEREAVAAGGRRVSLSDEVLSFFLEHSWPGNVRELQNVLQYARIKCHGEQIGLEHLPPTFRSTPPAHDVLALQQSMTRLDRESVAAAIAQAGGNRSEAAKLLGVSRATLYRFLAKQR